MRLVVRIAVGQRTADHVADQRILVERMFGVDVDMADGLAISNDLHRIGGGRDLIELVRDDDGGDAVFLAQLVDQVEQFEGILIIQGRGRLVENEQPHILGQCLGDFDELLLADADVGDQGVRVFVESHQIHHAQGFLALGVGVDGDALLDLIAQEDVLLDRHIRHQGKFLMDNHDTLAFGIANGLEFAGLAVVDDIAFIGAVRVHARQHVHQRRFAGAVFTADGEYLATFHGDIHILERSDRAETLDDMIHLQNHVIIGSHSNLLRCVIASRLLTDFRGTRERRSGAVQARRSPCSVRIRYSSPASLAEM